MPGVVPWRLLEGFLAAVALVALAVVAVVAAVAAGVVVRAAVEAVAVVAASVVEAWLQLLKGVEGGNVVVPVK